MTNLKQRCLTWFREENPHFFYLGIDIPETEAVFFAFARNGYHGLFVIFGDKKVNGIQFENTARAAGYKIATAHGLPEFRKIIESYLWGNMSKSKK